MDLPCHRILTPASPPLPLLHSVAVNTAALALAFILALVWIIVSAVKHTSAVDACIEQFITEDSGTNSNQSEVNVTSGSVSGETLCNIFTWVQMGVMGGLWLALLLVEFYFALMCRFYQTEQREDHKRYNRWACALQAPLW